VKFVVVGMWQLLALFTILVWGFWGVLIKVASASLEWHQVYIWTSIASPIAALTVYLFHRSEISVSSASLLALMAGVLGALGYISFVTAVKLGKASLVVPLTALYPAVTVIASRLILGEKISTLQIAGVILAIIAAILISLEPK